MSDYLIHDSSLENIANAIRVKTGTSSSIAVSDMPNSILQINDGQFRNAFSIYSNNSGHVESHTEIAEISGLLYCTTFSINTDNTWLLSINDIVQTAQYHYQDGDIHCYQYQIFVSKDDEIVIKSTSTDTGTVAIATMYIAKASNELTIFTNTLANNILVDGIANVDFEHDTLNTSLIQFYHGNNYSDFNNSSQYFLQPYFLKTGQNNAKNFYIDTENGWITKDNVYGVSWGAFAIPIKRLYGYNYLKYDGKTRIDQSSYRDLRLGAMAIENGIATVITDVDHEKVTAWTTYTVDVSVLPYIDYLIFYGYDGAPAYRNISLLRKLQGE